MKEQDTFQQGLALAATLPYVKIAREPFLRKTLSRRYSPEVVEKAIEENPKSAGIPEEMLDILADDVIKYETTKVTSLSVVAGIPGGFAMMGTIPADSAQYVGHLLRVAQKLGYLYGWDDFCTGGELDDGAKNDLTIFVGVMFGVETANIAISQIAIVAAEGAAKKIARAALTKTWYYPMVKKIANVLSIKMTKEIFAKSVSKAIPLLGGVASGSLTYATFKPMSKRLKNKLAMLQSETEYVVMNQEDVIEIDFDEE